MKTFLRSLLAWIERKFPDQVILTPDTFNAWGNTTIELRHDFDDHVQVSNNRNILLENLQGEVKRLSGIGIEKEPIFDIERIDKIEADLKKLIDEFSKLSMVMGFAGGRKPFER